MPTGESYDCCICYGTIVTGSVCEKADIGIKNGSICRLSGAGSLVHHACEHRIMANNLHILPGVIDTQVHFREPGYEHKENLHTGSLAAVMGGVTCVFEMPNTKPATIGIELLEDKLQRAKNRMYCDYAFYAGACKENIDAIEQLENTPGCCGMKIFMGSSTGSLLVDDSQTLERIISRLSRRAAFHCEDEERLRQREYLRKPNQPQTHSSWRDSKTAYLASERLLQLAQKYRKPVHILHISSAEEIELLSPHRELVSLEVTPQHLTLSEPQIYDELQNFAQMNPPLRDNYHQQHLWQALNSGKIDIIGSDHAPHTIAEKQQSYPNSPSGMPGVQTLVNVMLDHVLNQRLTLQKLVAMTSENVHKLFRLPNKGKIAINYDADFTIVDLKANTVIKNQDMLSLCQWTAFHEKKCRGKLVGTIIRGKKAMWEKQISPEPFGQKIATNKSQPINHN